MPASSSFISLSESVDYQQQVLSKVVEVHGANALVSELLFDDDVKRYAAPWGGLRADPLPAEETSDRLQTQTVKSVLPVLLVLILLVNYFFPKILASLPMFSGAANVRKAREKLDESDITWSVNPRSKFYHDHHHIAVAQGGDELDSVLFKLQDMYTDTHGEGSVTGFVARVSEINKPLPHPQNTHSQSSNDDADDFDATKDKAAATNPKAEKQDSDGDSEGMGEVVSDIEQEALRLGPHGVMDAIDQLRSLASRAETIWEGYEQNSEKFRASKESGLQNLLDSKSIAVAVDILDGVGSNVVPTTPVLLHTLKTDISLSNTANTPPLEVSIRNAVRALKSLPEPDLLIENLSIVIEILHSTLKSYINTSGRNLIEHFTNSNDIISDTDLQKIKRKVLDGEFETAHEIPFDRMLPGHVIELSQTLVAHELHMMKANVMLCNALALMSVAGTAVQSLSVIYTAKTSRLQVPCERRNQNKFIYGEAGPACPINGKAVTDDRASGLGGFQRVVTYSCNYQHPSCTGPCYEPSIPSRTVLPATEEFGTLFPLTSLPADCKLEPEQLIDPSNILAQGVFVFSPYQPSTSLHNPSSELEAVLQFTNGQISLVVLVDSSITPSTDKDKVIFSPAPYQLFAVELTSENVRVQGSNIVSPDGLRPLAYDAPPQAKTANTQATTITTSSSSSAAATSTTVQASLDRRWVVIAAMSAYPVNNIATSGFAVFVEGVPVAFVPTGQGLPFVSILGVLNGNVLQSSLYPCGRCGSGKFRQSCTSTSAGTCEACSVTCSPGHFLYGCSTLTQGSCVKCFDCPINMVRVGCNGSSPGTCVNIPKRYTDA
eukprot:c10570_g1_i1.p1 GENE.c10570_g1_i1~~c10570_g1_i1.p1  ORF type:complete len:938 (-),score=271.39 c10570_g1_i1:187-2682(-)